MEGSSWIRGRWWGLAPALALFLAIAGAQALYTIPRFVGPTEDMRSGPRAVAPGNFHQASFLDYRDTAWLPVRDMQEGGNPYDAVAYQERHPYAFEFTYLPAQLTLFFPLAQLPWELSAISWFIGLIVGALLLGWATVWIAQLPRRLDLLVVVAGGVLLLKPMAWMIQSGQTSVVPVIATTVALGRRRQDTLTTVCVALAWLKPQFGIPLVILLWVLDVHRPAVRGTALAAVVSIPAALWASVNAGGIGPFLASLPSGPAMAVSERSTQFVSPDLSSLVGHLTGWTHSTVLIAACFVVVIALGGWASASVRRHDPGMVGLLFVIGVTTVLLCIQHQDYDLVILAPAAVACGVAAGRSWVSGSPRSSTLLWGALALLLALAVVPRGTAAVQTRELQLTLALLAVVALLVIVGSDYPRRAAFLLLIAASALAVLRYGPDTAGAAAATAYGVLPTTALLSAWVLCVLWGVARRRSGEAGCVPAESTDVIRGTLGDSA